MNKAVLGIMLIALVAGGVVGAAMMGMIDIPGLTPAKKNAAAALYEGDKTGTADSTVATDSSSGSAAKGAAGDGQKAAAPPTAGPKTSDPKATTAAAGDTASPAASGKAQHAPVVAASGAGAGGAKTAGAGQAKPKITFDADLGCRKAAKLWGEMGVDALLGMIHEYKGADLPRILALMDNSKVAKVLEKMKAVDAAKLTKAIQREASKVGPGPA